MLIWRRKHAYFHNLTCQATHSYALRLFCVQFPGSRARTNNERPREGSHVLFPNRYAARLSIPEEKGLLAFHHARFQCNKGVRDFKVKVKKVYGN